MAMPTYMGPPTLQSSLGYKGQGSPPILPPQQAPPFQPPGMNPKPPTSQAPMLPDGGPTPMGKTAAPMPVMPKPSTVMPATGPDPYQRTTGDVMGRPAPLPMPSVTPPGKTAAPMPQTKQRPGSPPIYAGAQKQQPTFAPLQIPPWLSARYGGGNGLV